MSRRKIFGALAFLTAAAGALGYTAGRARANVPTTGALVYSGLLQQNGQDVEGPQSLDVVVYDAAIGGNLLCRGAATGLTPVVKGYFQVPMQDACAGKLQEVANAWVEVQLAGIPVAREKVGAVPYALQAAQADTLSGPLGATVTALGKQFIGTARLTQDSSTCAVAEQTPAGWIESATRTSHGECAIKIASDAVKASPVCTLTGTAGGYTVSATVNANQLQTRSYSTYHGAYDQAFQIVCIGEKP